MSHGIFAGITAGALWGLAFIAPNFIGAASAGELVIARYAVYGLMAIAYLWLTGYDPFRRLGLADWVRAVLFGALGNSIYYFLTVMSVQAGDAATTALVIGTLPVLFAIVGNLRHPTTPWLHLLMAVAPITLGVVLLAHQGAADAGPRSIMIGIVFALAAMTSWLIYGLGNSAYMASDHSLTPMLWAALIGIGTLLSLPLLAVALTLRHGSLFSLEIAAYTPLLFWGIILGGLASWLATWLWNIAGSSVPSVVLGYLLVSETLFALLYSFLLDRRLPSAVESTSAALLIGGTLIGLYVSRRRSKL